MRKGEIASHLSSERFFYSISFMLCIYTKQGIENKDREIHKRTHAHRMDAKEGKEERFI